MKHFIITLILAAFIAGCAPCNLGAPGENNSTRKVKDAVIVNETIKNTTRVK